METEYGEYMLSYTAEEIDEKLSKIDGLSEKVENMENSDRITTNVSTDNIFAPDIEWENGFINTSGDLTDSENLKTTKNYLEVIGGYYVSSQLLDSDQEVYYAQIRSLAEYDRDKNLICITSFSTEPCLLNTNTQYVKISMYNQFVDSESAMIICNKDGSLSDGYTAHGILRKELREEVKVTEKNLFDLSAKYKKSLTVGTSARNFNSFDYNAEDFITVKKFLAATSKTDWLYGLYDELMETYPDYITKTKIAETAEPITFYSSTTPERTVNYMPDVSEFTEEYMNVSANGTSVSYGSSTGVKTSPFIEVPVGKILSVQYLYNNAEYQYVSSVRAIAAFDADNNFISGANNIANGGVFTIPDNAKYLRVCISKNYIDNFNTFKTMFVVNNDGALLSDYVENGMALPVRTGLKTGIPMYRYDFKPPVASRTIASTAACGQTPIIPKILYVGGIHGGEYLTTMAAFRFFKMLCDRWKEEELLSDLFWNVHFVVIPTANPFGYEYPSKRYGADGSTMGFRNEHGIDVSGNFPSDNYVENEGSVYKYGKAPLTEPESIALYNIICNEEFILSIDNHNFNHIAGAANTDKMGGYLIANQFIPNSVNFWWKISRCLNPKLRILSPNVASNYDAIQVWTDSRHQMLNNTFRSVSANIEMSLGIDPELTYKEEGVSSMDEETQAFCVDTFAVVFHEALRDFYNY